MSASKKKHLTRSLLGAVMLFLIAFVPILPKNLTSAQSGGSFGGGGASGSFGGGSVGGADEEPYGGLNLVQIYCTCSSNFLITLWDYKTDMILDLLYQPGESVLYEYYDIFGQYLLGTYRQGGTCQIYYGYGCYSIEADGTMGSQPGTGTSL
jgi:hypothetical protein